MHLQVNEKKIKKNAHFSQREDTESGENKSKQAFSGVTSLKIAKILKY